MVFRGLEIRDKGIYTVTLEENGFAIYQQRGERTVTSYTYRLHLNDWRGNNAYSLGTNSCITGMSRELILDIRPSNENEVALLRSFVERTGGSL
jgi:hypothetical protein